MSYISNYYVRSSALALGCLLLSACATLDRQARTAPRVAFTELPQHADVLQRLVREPILLRFDKGTQIPVEFLLDASFLETDTKPVAFKLIASQTFYVLLGPKGTARVSLDGVHFTDAPKNSFRFGFHVAEGKAELELGVGLAASGARRKR